MLNYDKLFVCFIDRYELWHRLGLTMAKYGKDYG